jgi:hypothetical protein
LNISADVIQRASTVFHQAASSISEYSFYCRCCRCRCRRRCCCYYRYYCY